MISSYQQADGAKYFSDLGITFGNLMIRPAFLALVLALIGIGSGVAAPAGKPDDKKAIKAEKVKLAADVYKIFEAKCADCHGAHLPKPKGKFGYVLDLKRMAENPKYVVPGDPNESELYQLVKSDEMPGEDADVPPLTPEEKRIVERWVQIGAPGELPATV
ncbi:MAG: c-type cytochrome domain-containing protein, partial [Verrucomicrobiales bacterium]